MIPFMGLDISIPRNSFPPVNTCNFILTTWQIVVRGINQDIDDVNIAIHVQAGKAALIKSLIEFNLIFSSS